MVVEVILVVFKAFCFNAFLPFIIDVGLLILVGLIVYGAIVLLLVLYFSIFLYLQLKIV
jgi:hypothetical protein